MTAEQMQSLAAGSTLQPKTPEQGAATSVLFATSPQLEGIAGRYFESCNGAWPVARREGSRGVAPYALDPDNAERLWEVSLDLLRASAPAFRKEALA